MEKGLLGRNFLYSDSPHIKANANKRNLEKVETKEIKKSSTDPDSGYMMRDNKPEEFFYLYHRTVDNKNNVIVDVHVTPCNLRDSDPILKKIDRIINVVAYY